VLFAIGEAPQHKVAQARVNERPHALRQAVECAEGGELVAPAHQFFDSDVDQVGGVVLYRHRCVHDSSGNVPRSRIPRANPQELADGGVMAVQRASADVRCRIGR
jgi:hypothetical protein